MKVAQISLTIVFLAVLVGLGWIFYQRTQLPDLSQDERALYESEEHGFSFRYPAMWTLDEGYVYQSLGPEREIPGVSVTVPPSFAEDTNLASDTRISFEPIVGAVNSCSAEIYLSNSQDNRTETQGGRFFSIASAFGAAAGNSYEEIVYATPVDWGCLGVRYFIHSSNLGVWEEGTVEEYDREALLRDFDNIRRSLIVQ